MKNFRVLSLFDGCAMAHEAIKRSHVGYHRTITYIASEIDKYATLVADKRVPFYRNVGDVRLVSGYTYDGFDLLIGGSPCTQLSIAGNGEGLKGEASSLFWEYVRIKREGNFKYFLLENVASMRNADRDIISEALGVQPLRINASRVSGQNRDRYYWTNIPVPENTQPIDMRITLSDVIHNAAVYGTKSPAIRYFLSEKAIAYMGRERAKGKARWEFMPNKLDGKASTLTANMWKGVPYGVIQELGRRLTPEECELLQTLPVGYTDVDGVSESQRYKMIGNGFCVDVVKWILNFIPREDE